MRLGVILFQSQSARVGRCRRFHLALSLQDAPEIVVKVRLLVMQGDGFGDQFDRRVTAAGLMAEQPQGVQGKDMARLVPQQLAVNPLGGFQASGLMMVDGLGEQIHALPFKCLPVTRRVTSGRNPASCRHRPR